VGRYLGSDGRIAADFVSAVTPFVHPDHFLISSKDAKPRGYESWPIVDSPLDVGGQRGSTPLTVPAVAKGELGIILYGISAAVAGMITIPRWRSARSFEYGDGLEMVSEDESRFASVRRLRRIEEVPKPVPVQVPVTETWSYRAETVATEDSRRTGMFINRDRFKDALAAMEASLLDYKPPVIEPGPVVTTEEGDVTLVDDGVGVVESPGGSVVCELPVNLCHKLNNGRTLEPRELMRLLQGAKPDPRRFVGSKLFDCFAGPWEAILRSLLDEPNIAEIVTRGAATVAYGLVDLMRQRFSTELASVLSRSHVFRRKFLRVFKKTPSADKLMHEIRSGAFNGIAQSDAFIGRVKFIKELIDSALIRAESHNVYLPAYITSAQRGLPIQGHAPLGLVGRDYAPLPSQVSSALVGSRQVDRLRNRFANVNLDYDM